MPYIYKAEIKAKELAHSFRKRNDIPLSIKMDFFKFLAKSIENIFIKYKNDEKKIRDLLLEIQCSKPEEPIEFAKEPEEINITKLFHGDIDTFKQTIGNIDLSKEELKKYSEVGEIFTFSHIVKLSCELYKYSISNNKSILYKAKKKHENKTMPTMIEDNDELRYTN